MPGNEQQHDDWVCSLNWESDDVYRMQVQISS